MRLKSTKGFSIIELLIVIAIVAVIGVIAVPNFTKYLYNNSLREAAQEIVAEMQFYKKKAVAEHRRYLLYYPPMATNQKRYVYTMTCTSGFCYDNPPIITQKLSDDSAIIVSSTDPYPHFQNNTIGLCWAFVVLDRRGTMGQGSMKLRHMKTNSTATINTTFLGRVYVTYNMQ